MKKAICFVLVLLACTSVAHADNLRIKSDQELRSMYLEIQSILISRSKEYSIELDAGKYVAGTDIPVGSYRIECKGSYSSATVKVRSSASSSSYPDTYILAELYNSSVIGKLDLEKGNILEIVGSKVTMTGYNAANTGIAVEQTTGTENKTVSKESFKVSPGKYLVGDEIPAGTYRVVCEGVYSMVTLSVFDSKTSVFASYSALMSALIGTDEIGKLELKKGNYVEISDGSVMFYPYGGVKK